MGRFLLGWPLAPLLVWFSWNLGGHPVAFTIRTFTRHALPRPLSSPCTRVPRHAALAVPGSWPSVEICASSDISLPWSFGISSGSSPSHVRSWFRSCVSPRLDQSLRDRLCTAVSSLYVFHVDLNSQSVNGGPDEAAGGACRITNHQNDLCPEVSADRSQDFGGTCSDRQEKNNVFGSRRGARSWRLFVSYRWESQQFSQHDPNDLYIQRPPWCKKPSMSFKNYSSHSSVRAKSEAPSYCRAALIFARPSASVFELAAVPNRSARLRILIPKKSIPRPHADPARRSSVGKEL